MLQQYCMRHARTAMLTNAMCDMHVCCSYRHSLCCAGMSNMALLYGAVNLDGASHCHWWCLAALPVLLLAIPDAANVQAAEALLCLCLMCLCVSVCAVCCCCPATAW